MPRKPTLLTHQGETLSLTDWSAKLSIPLSTLFSRLKQGWSVEATLTTPVNARFRPVPAEVTAMDPPPLRRRAGDHDRQSQARIRVTVNGRQYTRYFGVWGAESTRRAYSQFCRDWVSLGPLAALQVEVTHLCELVELYLEFVSREYRKRGKHSSEYHAQRSAMRRLVEIEGDRPVSQFGVDQFRGYQRHLAERRYARKTIRDHSNRVLQLVRFGAERGLVSGEQWDRLRAARRIRRGAGLGVATAKRKPVPAEQIEAVFPHLHRDKRVREMLETMIRVQLLAGLRPREICVLRGAEIDRACGEEWKYTVDPKWNKLDHLELEQVYYFGPKVRALLGPLLDAAGPDEYLFRLPGKTAPVERLWYCRSITRACKLAGVPHWTPHRLRHNKATAVLGHTGSYREAGEAIGDSEEVARRNYTDSEAIRRRIAKETG